jgi:hypothetical protein
MTESVSGEKEAKPVAQQDEYIQKFVEELKNRK